MRTARIPFSWHYLLRALLFLSTLTTSAHSSDHLSFHPTNRPPKPNADDNKTELPNNQTVLLSVEKGKLQPRTLIIPWTQTARALVSVPIMWLLYSVMQEAFPIRIRRKKQTTKHGKEEDEEVGGVERDIYLPSMGLLGEQIDDLLSVVLNAITIYIYKDKEPDCGPRLLCEFHQEVRSRGVGPTLLAYVAGFLLSFWIPNSKVIDSLQAMRSGRRGDNCLSIYPGCPISLK